MTMRRCVICGERPPVKDAQGNNAYAYPKNEEEARIWQASMAAKDCCVHSIQKECCVCVEHIPDFVSRAKAIGNELSAQEKKRKEAKLAAAKEKEKEKGEAADECVQCPDIGEPAEDREKPTVSVLLLNGSSLPTYCAEGKGSCVDSRPAEKGDCKGGQTKRIKTKESKTEIYVQESAFQDSGGKCPDIDGTEVTLMRAPTQEEDELKRLQEELLEGQKPDEDYNCRRRSCCLPGCTDVLLLGRGQHETDVCPCKCEQCSKPCGNPDPEPCCQPECCPKSEPVYSDQPPCGCECEQQVRRELGKVIETQAQRILELEELLCRQNSRRNCLQRKLDELYCEFGRLDEAEIEAHRSRLTCPGSERGGPDCTSVFTARSEPPAPEIEPPEMPPKESRSILSRLSSKRVSIISKRLSGEQSQQSEFLLSPPVRVHGFAERKPESTERTRRPQWVNEAESEDNMANTSIKFNKEVNYSTERLSVNSKDAPTLRSESIYSEGTKSKP
ncbi:hypothetical protein KR059_010630, partial [Drosophila kikkawai]